jgi:rod shape determining protein RodA
LRRDLVSAAVGRASLRHFPWHLFLAMLVLTGVGAAFIYSSHSWQLAQRHLAFAGLGCVAFLALALLDYHHLASLAAPLYALCLASLAGLFVLGISLNYARRWYDLGFFHAQPSEPMKYVLVILLADYYRFRRRPDRASDVLVPLALTGVPLVLVVLQPDMGTAMTFAPVFLVVAYLAGVPLRNLLLLVLAGAVLVLGAWFTPGVMKDYQRSRVISFIDPGADPDSAAAYNAQQATMAVAAGGLGGQGWGQGVLTRLRRIPEQYADFIFAVIAEEWGFARVTALIVLYLGVMVLLALIARGSGDAFGRLLVGGVLTIFAVQTFLHMAVSLRLAPITGLTLPLVSYGGSSLLSVYAGLGMAASVRMHRSTDFGHEEGP